MKNRLKKTTLVPRRPVGIASESDRVLDEDLLSSLHVLDEEGEINEEDH